MYYFLLPTIFSLVFSANSYSSTTKLSDENKKLGYFSGRVSRVHSDSKMVRVKTDFENLKYINKQNKLEFWHERNTQAKCQGYILGKSPEYLLIKIPQLSECKFSLSITPNSYLVFYSEDLLKNINIGKELVDILLKKRFALESKLKRNQQKLESYIEKMDLLNKRYANILEQVEQKKRGELSELEEEKTVFLEDFHRNKRRLEEVEYKLQRYEIADKNFIQDKWALDEKFYFKK